MAGKRPFILVIDGDREERMPIAALLRRAGFAVIATATERGATAAMRRRRFAAVVIAPPDGSDLGWVRRVCGRQPEAKAVLLAGPATMPLADADYDYGTLVKRPCDPRQLLGCVFEAMLRDADEQRAAPRHHYDAELTIATAKLACLANRQAVAAATGASRLARDLSRQIGELQTTCRRLAAARAIGPVAGDVWAG